MTNPISAVKNIGQSIWIDYIRRDMFNSGEFRRLIDMGVSGMTSNPTIFEKAISGNTYYDDALLALARAGKSVQEIYEALVIEDICTAADLLRPVYDNTGGADGFVSLEVNPLLAHDTNSTITEARRLSAAVNRPNVLIKVPATPEGIPAVHRLIGDGINVNVTLIFSLDIYQQVMEAYIAGLEDIALTGRDISTVASVASFFVSRLDTAVDTLLEERIQQGHEESKGLLGKTAVAYAKIAYQKFKATFSNESFAALQSSGARVQRPLWASTSTKNPAYSDVLYIEPLIGPDTVNTMPPATLAAFHEHGHAEATLERGLLEAKQTLESLEAADVSIEQVTAKRLSDGVKLFSDSFEKLLANIEEKKALLLSQ